MAGHCLQQQTGSRPQPEAYSLISRMAIAFSSIFFWPNPSAIIRWWFIRLAADWYTVCYLYLYYSIFLKCESETMFHYAGLTYGRHQHGVTIQGGCLLILQNAPAHNYTRPWENTVSALIIIHFTTEIRQAVPFGMMNLCVCVCVCVCVCARVRKCTYLEHDSSGPCLCIRIRQKAIPFTYL